KNFVFFFPEIEEKILSEILFTILLYYFFYETELFSGFYWLYNFKHSFLFLFFYFSLSHFHMERGGVWLSYIF
ncbi:hypothetical protein ACJX0J_032976, partial [Zea mays]